MFTIKFAQPALPAIKRKKKKKKMQTLVNHPRKYYKFMRPIKICKTEKKCFCLPHTTTATMFILFRDNIGSYTNLHTTNIQEYVKKKPIKQKQQQQQRYGNIIYLLRVCNPQNTKKKKKKHPNLHL